KIGVETPQNLEIDVLCEEPERRQRRRLESVAKESGLFRCMTAQRCKRIGNDPQAPAGRIVGRVHELRVRSNKLCQARYFRRATSRRVDLIERRPWHLCASESVRHEPLDVGQRCSVREWYAWARRPFAGH